MKRHLLLSGMFLFCLLAAVAAAATTTTSSVSVGSSTTLSPEQALSSVYVSSVTLDPQVFYPYEDGTITVQLSNSGSQSVALSSADLLDKNILVKNKNPYNTMIYLGPGNTMTYTFLVTAKPPEGTYFPVFTLSSRDAGSIRYPIKVEVDSTDIRAGISKKPDNFAYSTPATVNLSIINPRDGEVTDIIVLPAGDRVTVSPANYFQSSIAAGSSVDIPFTITPNGGTNVTFQISYHNGNNRHTANVILPLAIAEDKSAAVPLINNVALVSKGSYYELSGDVSNAGITDAKAMVISVGAPARAVEPYADYAVGSLASDDFSSFTLTFATNDLGTVPVRITWKDNEGNSFSTTKNLDLRSISGATGSMGTRSGSLGSSGSASAAPGSSAVRTGGPQGGGFFGFGNSRAGGIGAFYPVIAGGLVILVAVVLWMKRKWILAKFKKQ